MKVKEFRLSASHFFLGFIILLITTANGNSQVEEDSANKCKGTNFSVEVSVVKPINFSGKEFYLLEYSYNFKDEKTIFLKNVGELPATGEMKHLYEGKSLEFLTIKPEKLLCKVDLKPNKRPSEGGADDVPSPSVFTSYKSSSASAGSNSQFLDRLTNLLNNENFTYRINNQNGTTSVISNYRRIKGLPRNLLGEIAVQINFPHQVSGNQFSFHIYYHARQKPRRSEEWENIRAENQEVVDNLINSLTQGLR